MIKYDFYTYTDKKVEDLNKYKDRIDSIKATMLKKSSMLDWLDKDTTITNEEIKRIKEISKSIREKADVFLVIGIGGSYLGAYSFIEAFKNYFTHQDTEVIFAGYSLSSEYLKDLFEYIKDKDIVVNFISKSGSTMEVNIVYQEVLKLLNDKYDDITDRVIITTDKESNLMKYAKENNFVTFEVPRNIGGRYSVFSPVGLLPICVSNINVDEVLKGLEAGKEDIDKAMEYACIRDLFYNEGKVIESFGVYEEKLLPFCEWLKQLFAETQGKENKAILPISTCNTRDLHSLGQFYQEGNKILFETNFKIEKTTNIYIDKYNKNLSDINNLAVDKVAEAHMNGKTYSNIITIDELNPYNLAKLMYFFMISAATGGYLLNIDPFNQPGVEEYKKLLKDSLN